MPVLGVLGRVFAEQTQGVIAQRIGDVVDAVAAGGINVFDFALPHFRVRVFVVLLGLHVNPWNLGVKMLHCGPKENVIAVLYIQHDLPHVEQLLQLEVVELEEVARDEGRSWFCDGVVEGGGVALVDELCPFGAGVEPVASDFVGGDWAEVLEGSLVVASEGIPEGVAVDDDVVVEGVEELGGALGGEVIAVIHGVEGGSEEVDWDFPERLGFENRSIFWVVLVVPHNVDF